MKKILILTYTNLDRDPRPNRQISLLNNDFEVWTIGTTPSTLEKQFIELKKKSFVAQIFRLILLKLRLYNLYYWDKYKKRLVEKIDREKFDIIIAHEIRLVPLALKIGENCKIILDAHEYSPENFEDDFFWRFLFKRYYTYLCGKYINKCDRIITVSEGIAHKYEKNFNVKVDVITNACNFVDLRPKKIDPKKIKIIHHGIVSSSRNLELLINIMGYLDDYYQLDLMLVVTKVNKRGFDRLKRFAKQQTNIRIIPPIKYSEIIGFINNYDIGLIFFPPSNFNLEFSLPNKFYDFIQARLAIATGPSIEMSSIVKKYNLGIVTNSFNPQEMATAIKNCTINQLAFYKEQVHKYAFELSSNSNNDKIRKIISETLQN